MDLSKYFQEHTGTGVLATAADDGKVNTAIYARPHVFDNKTVAFIMRDRLSRQNLLKNGSANYLFIESGAGYKGVRLGLTMIDESTDPELIASLSKRLLAGKEYSANEARFAVRFSVDKGLALVGGEEIIFE
ncbi:pyridoxamine 5'-phosphate oxidase family protein [Desulfopila sp. IMCC35006]|uniref:pyridoxamine 5'-phosphate oxidase family protein n=1 Tax=Desulfopila sp. IMCC35006 TaxID=2569542 RepID=UPI0010ABA70B|nr:pyridoxamine 5'-phosphate oxidase family protein [Desulfopila sp. IMCC35006]TKB24145.1 pyridoxamine 5'-phosphate oxidase family protein [Desulfopila sp. IMCC35006]